MSFENPTALKLGMTGNLLGKRYRVVGRVVIGMEEAGETYCWNEFNLEGDDGESADLVYEKTERGGEWRLFTMFEPKFPMTAEDAATKQVGDRLNLDGTDVRVTLVDQSRVYHIEGKAPEVVEVGDIANYFNCEAGNKMQVVSWSGDEIEFYHGKTFLRGTVESVFGIRSKQPASSFLSYASETDSNSFSGGWTKSVLVLIAVGGAFFWMFGSEISCAPRRLSATIKKTIAPASPLSVGSAGTLDGKQFRVASHAVAEVAQAGQLFDRHEYYLTDETGQRALLIYGTKPGAKDWMLFTLLEPAEPLTPQQAAAVRFGQPVNIDGYIGPVSELFQTVIREAEHQTLPFFKTGDLLFGFAARSGTVPLLVRWNDARITFYRGKELPEKEVTAAFTAPAAEK